jgi:hypothetical protein
VALKWSSVRAQHVERACAEVASRTKDKASGIVVWSGGRALPAKEVLRVAYRLANNLPDTAELRFSSGDGSIGALQRLGFRAERLGSSKPAPSKNQ